LGVALAIATIESSHPWFGIAASILLLGLAFLRPWREHDTFLKPWTARPVGRFVIASAVTTIVAELLYRLIVGSWKPPSGMGL
jgi:hypothetical protein